MDNQTYASEFVLLKFSNVPELQILHFFIFLILYLAAIIGNLLVICTIAFDHRLHIPMYFFLMNLALMDLGQLSVIMPKFMLNSLMNTTYISYAGCVAQVFLFLLFAGSDFFPPHSDGIRSVCCHLQTITIRYDHEQESLCANDG